MSMSLPRLDALVNQLLILLKCSFWFCTHGPGVLHCPSSTWQVQSAGPWITDDPLWNQDWSSLPSPSSLHSKMCSDSAVSLARAYGF